MGMKRKIIIALGVLLVALIVGILIIGVVAYRLYSTSSGDGEMVFAPTEVGTPVGDRVTKNIGPAGGMLVSLDGRLILTVPANALTETLPFAIQPITNKFSLGLGLGYRLEPDGKTFTTPLEISFHYDDHDLEGTIPEALAIGYQDNAGAWHVQRGIAMDKDKKTITLFAEHFTDYTLDYILGLSPSKATVHVGESVTLVPSVCGKGLVDELKERFFGVVKQCEPGESGWGRGYRLGYELVGEGQLKAGTLERQGTEIYTAPAKKPKPNIAIVWFKDQAFDVLTERPCQPWEGAIAGKNDERWVPRKHCYRSVPGPGSVKSVITIVDRGYRASGNAGGDTVFSGDICDLENTFTLETTNPFLSSFRFVPNKPNEGSPNEGKWSFTTQNGVSGGGSGRYTITGTDTKKTGIDMNGFSTGTVRGATRSGGGTMHLDLRPIDTECKQGG